MTETTWHTLAEGAEITKFSKRTLRNEIKKGRLRAAKIGGRGDIRIARAWLDDFLEAAATPIEIVPRRLS